MSAYNRREKVSKNQDSYANTAVPCGNPHRYGSSEVVRMTTGKRKMTSDDDVETEAEKQLQAMAKKQLHTNITLKEQISQHRSFASSGDYKPMVKSLSGVSELDRYHKLVNEDMTVEELRNCGLTEAEIRLKMGTEKQDEGHRYGVHPAAHSGRLEEIEQRILEKEQESDKPSSSSHFVVMGRRELEIEQRLAGENSQTRALSNFLTKQRVVKGDPNDPLNNLPVLLKDIERKGRDRKAEKMKEIRKMWPTVPVDVDASENGDTDDDSEFIGPCLPEETINAPDVKVDSNIKGDNRTDDNVVEVEVKDCDSRVSDSKAEDIDEVKDCDSRVADTEREDIDSKGRRIVTESIEDVPEDVIIKYRLTVEEILKLPRFEKYAPGEPSNVLYLKNLTNKVTESDLVSLFGRFQKDGDQKIVYRLMKGRMRGQAFVTFNDAETATLALDLCNGYHFRGKPIIIQYGKKSQENST